MASIPFTAQLYLRDSESPKAAKKYLGYTRALSCDLTQSRAQSSETLSSLANNWARTSADRKSPFISLLMRFQSSTYGFRSFFMLDLQWSVVGLLGTANSTTGCVRHPFLIALAETLALMKEAV